MRAVYGLLLLGSLFTNAAWAWDGDWTDGRARMGEYLYDKGSSQGKAGSDPPQTFLIPPTREYIDVDGEELSDYFNRHNKDYAPHALTRISQTLYYGPTKIPKGYYLIKIGLLGAGSPNSKQKADAEAAVQTLPPLNPKPATQAAPYTSPKAPVNASKLPAYRQLVFIQTGRVIATVPIHRVQAYKPDKKDKIPKHALAWIEIEDRHPVLKFYNRHWLYSTDFRSFQ